MNEMKGYFFSLMTVIAWGICPVLAKLGVRGNDPINAVIIRGGSLIVYFVIYALITGRYRAFVEVDFKSQLFLYAEGFLGAFLGQFLYYQAQKVWETSKVIIVVGAFPMIAFLLSVIILKEPLTIKKCIGILLVISGITLVRY